ncbi:MAG: hypothetical protein LBV68_05415 [Spirochaetaceae bacterium]|jgi:hypothetical protein|nr:hypothetical protein [Spirochaetaceae bacterium]
MDETSSIETLIAEIADIESLLLKKKAELTQLKAQFHAIATEPVKVESPVESSILQNPTEDVSSPGINNHSTPEDKISLFCSLFRKRRHIRQTF